MGRDGKGGMGRHDGKGGMGRYVKGGIGRQGWHDKGRDGIGRRDEIGREG